MRTVALTKESTKDILENLLKRSPNNYGKFEAAVDEILNKVKTEGDAALFAYTKEFDKTEISADTIKVTEEEIKEIVKNTIKPVVVNVFGMKDLMYSRRLLLTNYAKHYNISNKDMIDAKINDNGFKIFENEYGTYFYASKYYNALDLLDLDNVLYFWYNPVFLNDEEILDVVINNDVNNIDNDPLFLDKATTYRIGEAHD